MSALFTILMFIYQGWLDAGFFGRIFRRVRRNGVRIDDSSKQNDLDANQRAAEEESRRNEHRLLRRSFEKSARNVEVYNFKKSMIGTPSSIASSHTPSQNPVLHFMRTSKQSSGHDSSINPMQIS